MKRNYPVEVIAALFILLFIYTASSKFLDYDNFKFVLKSSPLIGKLAPFVALGLPILEIIIAFLLLFPGTRRKGLWASTVIMALFTGYIAYMIYFTPDRPCNCGGVLRQMTWNQHLVFNIAFFLLAILGLWLDKRISTRRIENKLPY